MKKYSSQIVVTLERVLLAAIIVSVYGATALASTSTRWEYQGNTSTEERVYPSYTIANRLQLPDYIYLDKNRILQVRYHAFYFTRLPDNLTYKTQNLSKALYSRISKEIESYRKNSNQRNPQLNISYKIKDLKLEILGFFPVKFVVLTYMSPITMKIALEQTSIIAEGINLEEPYLLQKNRSLYAGAPFDGSEIILESCLLHQTIEGKVEKVICTFSSP
jgi:hypothetical protein